LFDNGYPLNLIFNRINSRLKKLFVQKKETVGSMTNDNSNHEKKILVLVN